jgi:hypothetical protein
MASRAPRYDRYGRPLPGLADVPPPDLVERTSNALQRERILQRVRDTLDEHYPYLLRDAVSAEVTLSFSVVRGMIQEQLYVGIMRVYRPDEE